MSGDESWSSSMLSISVNEIFLRVVDIGGFLFKILIVYVTVVII